MNPMKPALAVLIAAASVQAAVDFQKDIAPILADNCLKCHGPEKQKAERRFDELPAAIATHDQLADFQDIIDQLQELDLGADEREELLRALNLAEATPDANSDEDPAGEDDATDAPEDVEPPATPDDSGPGAEDPPATALRSAHQALQRRIRVAMLTRSMQ